MEQHPSYSKQHNKMHKSTKNNKKILYGNKNKNWKIRRTNLCVLRDTFREICHATLFFFTAKYNHWVSSFKWGGGVRRVWLNKLFTREIMEIACKNRMALKSSINCWELSNKHNKSIKESYAILPLSISKSTTLSS